MNTLRYYKKEIESRAQSFLNSASQYEGLSVNVDLTLPGITVKDRQTNDLVFDFEHMERDFYEVTFVLNKVQYEKYCFGEAVKTRIKVNDDWLDITEEKFFQDFDKFIQLYE